VTAPRQLCVALDPTSFISATTGNDRFACAGLIGEPTIVYPADCFSIASVGELDTLRTLAIIIAFAAITFLHIVLVS
jgi:hypothetical protein